MRTLLLSAALLITAPALAHDHKGPRADLDGDGQVTRLEFDTQANARFDAIDTNFDGVLTEAERRAYGDERRDERRERRFERLDADGDGSISRAEMEAADATRDARREERRERMKARFDTDGDGMVSEAERAAAREARDARRAERGGDRGPRMRGKPRFDLDGDGAVTRLEYTTAHDALFARMDANGDGVLTRGEGRKGKRKRRFGGRR